MKGKGKLRFTEDHKKTFSKLVPYFKATTAFDFEVELTSQLV